MNEVLSFEGIAKRLRRYEGELEAEDARLNDEVQREIQEIKIKVSKVNQILGGQPFHLKKQETKHLLIEMEKNNFIKRIPCKTYLKLLK